MTCREVTITSQTSHFEFEAAILNPKPAVQGGDRSEAWDRETMFSQLAKRSSQNVDSGVRHNKYFRSTINLFEIVFRIYVYFVGGK